MHTTRKDFFFDSSICHQSCNVGMEYQHIKILNVCLCIMEVESSRGRTTVVTCDLCTFYTLYCVCVITNGCTWGAAAEENAVEEQQLKWTQSRNSKLKQMQSGTAAEVDAVREQQLKWMQPGRSLAWPCKTSACQGHYRTRLLVCQSRGLRQTHTGVVKEVRPQKHKNYICSKERTVVYYAVLTRKKVRAPQPLHCEELQLPYCSCRQTKGCLESLDCRHSI